MNAQTAQEEVYYMNKYLLSKAGINVNEGVARMNGLQAMYEKYLYRFPTDPNYQAMLTALESGDVDAAFKAAHALKGLAGNLSLNQLYQNLYPLVEELRAGRLENVEQYLPGVRTAYDTAVAALAQSGQ